MKKNVKRLINKNVSNSDTAMSKKHDNEGVKTFSNVESVKDNTIAPTVVPVIEIIGDSHLNNITPNGISNKNNVIIHNHPESYITPSIKKNVI